jgi:hypothetical protein
MTFLLISSVLLLVLLRIMTHHKIGSGVSILIPFRCSDNTSARAKNFEWLKKYWATHLPGAEIIVADDPKRVIPFSKSIAVNVAAKKAKGDIFVIVDADGYIPAERVLYCVDEIRYARKTNRKLWFVPYRQFHRLTEDATNKLLNSDPSKPHEFSDPVNPAFTIGDSDYRVGHWYGAGIHIVPREAFEIVGGWDPRFRGWGGEDHAAMRATDTLYILHKTLPGQILHMWHPQIGDSGTQVWVPWQSRRWEGQTESQINNTLSFRYYGAHGRPDLMRKLVDEGHLNQAQESNESDKSDDRCSI